MFKIVMRIHWSKLETYKGTVASWKVSLGASQNKVAFSNFPRFRNWKVAGHALIPFFDCFVET